MITLVSQGTASLDTNHRGNDVIGTAAAIGTVFGIAGLILTSLCKWHIKNHSTDPKKYNKEVIKKIDEFQRKLFVITLVSAACLGMAIKK